MNSETKRRLWLGLGAVLLALGAAVTVQFVLVQENVVSRATEAYGVVAGVAVALPLALELVRPSDDTPATSRYRAAAVTVVVAAVAGTVAAELTLFSALASPLPAAVGAAVAYAGGQAARSFVLRGARPDGGSKDVPESAESSPEP